MASWLISWDECPKCKKEADYRLWFWGLIEEWNCEHCGYHERKDTRKTTT
jgi:uncharacterized metal-binding protein (TIGR02443 family)